MEYLPAAIIDRIQSFLTGKEAARTTLLSKSWRSAWLTHPDLNFDEQDHSKTEEFFDVVSKCMKRYEQSNLKFQSFSLIKRKAHSGYLEANKVIVEALRIGATRLSIRNPLCCWDYVLPNEVFASETLVELSAMWGTIRDVCPSSIRCFRLKSMILDHVTVENDEIANILLHCQSIEKLSMSDEYEYQFSTRDNKVTGVGECTIDLPKMRNLRSLVVSFLRFTTLFKGDLSSSMFPALQDLTVLEYKHGYRSIVEGDHRNPIRISEHSLEKLNFFISEGLIVRMAEFDYSSIFKFTYKGPDETSSLSFKSAASGELESHVSIKGSICVMSWFRRLNEILTRLRKSRIYLSLDVSYDSSSFDYDVEDIQGLPKPQVENLSIDTFISVPSISCYALFDSLFRICTPKCITQYLVPESRSLRWKANNYFLCGALGQKTTIGKKRMVQSLYMNCLDDLKEVSLHIWDEVDGEWHEMVPFESLLDAPIPTKKQKICFRMGWR